MNPCELLEKYNFQLFADQIHVWSVEIESRPTTFHYSCVLDNEQQQKMSLFHTEQLKNSYLIRHYWLRHILSYYLGIYPEEIHFKYNPYDKPYLVMPYTLEYLYFNISYSNNHILYAITKNLPIGIDLEYIQSRFFADIDAKLVFSCKEQLIFNQLNEEKEKNLSFYNTWVRKEALLKAMGTGLSISPSDISLSIQSKMPSIQILSTQWTDTLTGWLINLFSIDEYYVGALAVQKKNIKDILLYKIKI